MMAALASAAMPNATIAGTRDSEQVNATDKGYGIDHAVVQDAAGKLYDTFASNTPKGRKRLVGRVRAAQTLMGNRELGGLGFDVDRVLAFSNGEQERSVTGDVSVMIATHHDGQARPLTLLTLDDCASVGTALGAIHRLRPDFLQEAGYPVFSTGQIRAQLTAWIKRLRQAGHVPQEITTSWSDVLETDGLWSFATCPVHGGLSDGDVLFSGSSITAITNWQDMQVNDPARDLAWIFSKLDENHRNALLSAYGRMLGNRLDDLIMLRANLWVQMEQVGDFIRALNNADNDRIIQFKAQVDRLAHQLGVSVRGTQASHGATVQPSAGKHPSTITVGTLLQGDENGMRSGSGFADADDSTLDPDNTGSANISTHSGASSDSTASGHFASAPMPDIPPISSATIALGQMDDATGNTNVSPGEGVVSDDTNEHHIVANQANGNTLNNEQPQRFSIPDLNAPATEVIPLLEREERALHDAHTGLDASDVPNYRNIMPQA